jgi:signal peptidase II
VTGALVLAVVAADQASKSWVVSRLSDGRPFHVIWRLDLILEFNSGSAFSLAQGWAPFLAVVAVLLAGGLVVAIIRSRSTFLALALALVLGGALGNLTDRLFRSHRGAVVDFIALHFWPTFNLADSAIVVGGIAVALSLWRGPRVPLTQPDGDRAASVGTGPPEPSMADPTGERGRP